MMLMLKSDHRGYPKGQASIELLLVLCIWVLLIFGGIELSRGVALRQALDSGTGVAARALSLDPNQWNFAENTVQQAVNQNVMGEKPSTSMQVYDAGSNLRSPAWLSVCSFGTAFYIESEVLFQADIPFISSPAITIRVRH